MMTNLQIVKITPFLLIVFLAFLSAGCLCENYSNCSEGVVLKFKYMDAIGKTKVGDSPSLHRLSVFVFDGDGRYVCEKTDSTAKIDDNYTMWFPFYNGQYQFVVWAGLSDCFQLIPCIVGQTNIQDFTLQLKRDIDGNTFFSPELLYHGMQELVTLNPSQTEVITIGLQQITNTIRVILHTSDISTPPQVSIEDNNGLYNYRGEILPDMMVSYVPDAVYATTSPGTWVAEFNVMRLQTASDALLKINDSSGTLPYNEKLVRGLLGANPDINFDIHHDFVIEITFDAYYIPVSIIINGWELIPDEI